MCIPQGEEALRRLAWCYLGQGSSLDRGPRTALKTAAGPGMSYTFYMLVKMQSKPSQKQDIIAANHDPRAPPQPCHGTSGQVMQQTSLRILLIKSGIAGMPLETRGSDPIGKGPTEGFGSAPFGRLSLNPQLKGTA